jgi:hypothetical protein
MENLLNNYNEKYAATAGYLRDQEGQLNLENMTERKVSLKHRECSRAKGKDPNVNQF